MRILALIGMLLTICLVPGKAFGQRDRILQQMNPVSASCLDPRKRAGTACSYYRECLETAIQCEDTDFSYAISYGEKYCKRFEQLRPQFSPLGQQWVDDTMYCLQEVYNLWDGVTTRQDIFGSLCEGCQPESIPASCSGIRKTEFKSHPLCYLGGPTPFSKRTHVSVCELGYRDAVNVFRAAELQNSLDKEGIEQALVVVNTCVKYHAGRRTRPRFRTMSVHGSSRPQAQDLEEQRLLDFWTWKQNSYHNHKEKLPPPTPPASIEAEVKEASEPSSSDPEAAFDENLYY